MSATSPKAGAVSRRGAGTPPPAGKGDETPSRRAAAGELELELHHARWRHGGWLLAAVASGCLLIWKLGVVAQGLGVALFAFAVLAAWSFVRTFLRPPGRITVGAERVVLADGLCSGHEASFPTTELRHVYLLRRAAPWARSGPLLVVESSAGAFTFPRDWFATEGDQLRVAQALRVHLDRAS